MLKKLNDILLSLIIVASGIILILLFSLLLRTQ
jgi:hypothetical protein